MIAEAVAHARRRLEGAVGQQPVVADGDAEAGREVESDEHREVGPADELVPQQDDGGEEGEERHARPPRGSTSVADGSWTACLDAMTPAHLRRDPTSSRRRSCSLSTSGRAAPARARRRAAAGAARARRGDHRRDRPGGARLRPAARGAVRPRAARRRRARADPLRRRDRRARRAATSSRARIYVAARPRRAARRPHPRRAAERLPPRRAPGLGALRRRRRRRPGHEPAHALRARRARSSPTSTRSAPSRSPGFAAEQSRAAGERARRRRALVRLLARDDAAPEEVRDLALQAGLAASRRRRRAASSTGGPTPTGWPSRLGPEALAVDGRRDGRRPSCPTPTRPGGGAAAAAARRRARRRSGPPWPPSARTTRCARARAALAAAGGGPPAPPRGWRSPTSTCSRCCCTATTRRWPPTSQPRARAAGRAGPGPRARLHATLRAWLDHPGQVQRVAQRRCTCTRRRCAIGCGQLRELFGDGLEDPEQRFALGVALRIGEPSHRV